MPTLFVQVTFVPRGLTLPATWEGSQSLLGPCSSVSRPGINNSHCSVTHYTLDSNPGGWTGHGRWQGATQRPRTDASRQYDQAEQP